MTNEDLGLFFKSVSFTLDEDGFFVGLGQNGKGIPFKIAIFEQNIACFTDGEILFQVPFGIDLGTFLVLAQDFGIIHQRFIYESVESIEDEFLDGEDWEGTREEALNQIALLKNSKFLQLLKKGKKKY